MVDEMRRFSAIAFLLSILTCCTILFLPVEISSNPIVIIENNIDAGGLFMGDNVSMPESEVHIVLDPFDTGTFELKSVFTLTSEINQTLLTAFAYPLEWGSHSSDSDIGCDFEIMQNQEQVDFVILTFEQVVAMYNETTGNVTDEDVADWGWIYNHHFVTFNLSLIENTPKILDVFAASSFGVGAPLGFIEYSSFRYCVGSAYSWSGPTHEIITMEVKDIESRSFRIGDSVYDWEFSGFYPADGLTETWNQTWATAVWDLTLQDGDLEIITHVGFGGKYSGYSDPLIDVGLLSLILVPVAGVIVGGVYFAKRRFAN